MNNIWLGSWCISWLPVIAPAFSSILLLMEVTTTEIEREEQSVLRDTHLVVPSENFQLSPPPPTLILLLLPFNSSTSTIMIPHLTSYILITFIIISVSTFIFMTMVIIFFFAFIYFVKFHHVQSTHTRKMAQIVYETLSSSSYSS